MNRLHSLPNGLKSPVVFFHSSGGTDIISCFAGQNPTLPVYKGEIQSVNLGMAMESWDEEGKTVFPWIKGVQELFMD